MFELLLFCFCFHCTSALGVVARSILFSRQIVLINVPINIDTYMDTMSMLMSM